MRHLCCLLAAICLTIGTWAQQKCPMMGKQTSNDFHRKHRMAKEKWIDKLHLSEDQKKQMKAYQQEANEKMQQLKNELNITLEEFYNRSTAIRKEIRSKKLSLLTREQTDLLSSLKTNRASRKNERFEQHLIHLKYTLGLSASQMNQLQKIHESHAQAFSKIKQNDTWNDHDKRTRIQSLRQTQKEEIKKIFSADQMKQIEEMKRKKEAGRKK